MTSIKRNFLIRSLAVTSGAIMFPIAISLIYPFGQLATVGYVALVSAISLAHGILTRYQEERGLFRFHEESCPACSSIFLTTDPGKRDLCPDCAMEDRVYCTNCGRSVLREACIDSVCSTCVVGNMIANPT